MTNGYTKLFGSLVTSSIWCEDNVTRIVWITLLALCNREGVVEAALPGLANAAQVDVDACRKAIEKLSSPDEDSRSQEHEGRRIERIDGGFKILNFNKYAQMLSLEARREYHRIKMQEYRAKMRAMNQGKSISEIIKEKAEAEERVRKAKL